MKYLCLDIDENTRMHKLVIVLEYVDSLDE